MPGHTAKRGEQLTPKEKLVMAGAAHGRTAGEIAAQHGLTEATIRTYLRRAYVKLGARNKAHAVTICFVRGVLKVPAPKGRPS